MQTGLGRPTSSYAKRLEREYDIHMIRVRTPIPSVKVNIYFMEKPVPTLIDAPPEGTRYLDELDSGLRALKYSIRDIRRIIITHPHFDHYGSARTINEMNGAEVWAPKKGARWIEDYEKELCEEELYRTLLLEKAGVLPADINYVNAYYRDANCFAHGAKISRYLEGGDTFELASLSFAVTEVPGHTPFCILLHDDDKSMGFTGDFLSQDIASSPLVQWADLRSQGYKTLKAYIESLRKVREMNLKTAFPGHGNIIRDPTAKIDELLGFIDQRKAAVRRTLQGGSKTPAQILPELFPNHPREGLFRAVSEIMGHLELLEEEGIVERMGGCPAYFGVTS